MGKFLACVKDHSLWIYVGVAVSALILFFK